MGTPFARQSLTTYGCSGRLAHMRRASPLERLQTWRAQASMTAHLVLEVQEPSASRPRPRRLADRCGLSASPLAAKPTSAAPIKELERAGTRTALQRPLPTECEVGCRPKAEVGTIELAAQKRTFGLSRNGRSPPIAPALLIGSWMTGWRRQLKVERAARCPRFCAPLTYATDRIREKPTPVHRWPWHASCAYELNKPRS